MIYKLQFLFVFYLSWLTLPAQIKVNRLFEYTPAPGQYINTSEFGTPAAASSMLSGANKAVSLGAFGGYIVLGFEKPCLNDPLNPFGIDFTVFGNAFDGSSEPGIISVMSDTNGNGKPDDTWFGIAGSNHYHPKTLKNTSVVYFRTNTRDVRWKNSSGATGLLAANSYHTQEYYPQTSDFPGYPPDSVLFTGTWMTTGTTVNSLGILKLLPPAFGYADCRPGKTGTGPDNPYTTDVAEGYGGDPVDISWATDSLGNYVQLSSIDFVRISTGCLLSLGSLGEISTELSAITDTEPGSGISGKENLVILYSVPDRLLKNDSIALSAAYFTRGKKVATSMVFESTDQSLARVEKGVLKPLKTGILDLAVYPEGLPAEKILKKILITEPAAIEILNDLSLISPGDTIPLQVRITDHYQNVIQGILYEFIISDSAKAKVIKINNQNKLVAFSSGMVSLTVSLPGYPLNYSLNVKINEKQAMVNVYLTIKTATDNLLPFQKAGINPIPLQSYIENRKGTYTPGETPSLADAIARALLKSGAIFRYRENGTTGGNLFLYSVEKDGMFTYGWGGKTDPAAYARAWIARLNGKNHYSGFEKIKVHAGDTLIVYHVSDLLTDWELSMLIPEIFTPGKMLTVNALKTSCRFLNQEVTESLQAVVSNLAVQVESGGNKLTLYSDDAGQLKFVPESGNQILIKSNNDAILFSGTSTKSPLIENNRQLKAYPNPVSDCLFISNGPTEGIRWYIYDLSGRILGQGDGDSARLGIPVSALSHGIYTLKIMGCFETVYQKFLRQ